MAQPVPAQTPQGQDSLPATVDGLAAAVVGVYASTEQDLIVQSAGIIREAMDAPPNSPPRYMLYSRLQRAAQQASAGARMQSQALANKVADTAARNGNLAAAREAKAFGDRLTSSGNLEQLLPHDVNSARFIAEDLGKRLDAAAMRITRFADDAYRAATVSSALTQIMDKATPAEAQAQAWRELTAKGVTGFTDRTGRQWNLATYVEMATRTAAQKAYNASHKDRLTLAGIHYFTPSTTGRPCSLCVVEGTLVSGPAPVGAVRTEYVGDLITIRTASGKELTATPNHTVLTINGWRRMEELSPSDKVINDGGQEFLSSLTMPDHIQVPTRIEDVVKPGLPLLLARPAGRELDVNVIYREVQVVDSGSELLLEVDASLAEPFGDLFLIPRIGECLSCLSEGNLSLGSFGPLDTTASRVGGIDHGGTFDIGHGIPLTRSIGGTFNREVFGVQGVESSLQAAPLGARVDASTFEVIGDYPTADAEGGSELLRAFSGDVTTDEIVSLSVSEFSGHVWDIQTRQNWYSSNGIISHNCAPWEGKVLADRGKGEVTEPNARGGDPVTFHVAATIEEATAAGLFHPSCKHTLVAYLPGVTVLQTNQWSADDEVQYQNTQTLRRLERAVRAAKLQAAGAVTPLDKRRATAAARAGQQRIRDFTTQTGLLRRPRREQLDLGNKP